MPSRMLPILALSLGLGAVVVGCGESSDTKAKRDQVVREEKKSRSDAERSRLIAELRATYNADDE